MPLNGDTINADKLSGIDEESDIYEGFSPHVDRSQIVLPDPSPTTGKYFFHKNQINQQMLNLIV